VPRHPQQEHAGHPQAAPGGGRDGLGELGDDAGLDEGADHDEQAGEEQQGGPFDLAQEWFGVAAGHQQQEAGPEEGHD
jgi:hypothetical protein